MSIIKVTRLPPAAPRLHAVLPGRDTCTGACETAAGCDCPHTGQPPADPAFEALLRRVQWLRGCEGNCRQSRRACECHRRAHSLDEKRGAQADTGPDTVPLTNAPSAYRSAQQLEQRQGERRVWWRRVLLAAVGRLRGL